MMKTAQKSLISAKMTILFAFLMVIVTMTNAIKLSAYQETSCSEGQSCIEDPSGYMYDGIQEEQATLNEQYEQQADAMLAQDIAEAAWAEASDAQLASQQAKEIQIAQQEASEAQIEAVAAQEEVYEKMTEISNQALAESIRLQNEAFELQKEALDAQKEVATLALEDETTCACNCTTTNSTESGDSSTTVLKFISSDDAAETCSCTNGGDVDVVVVEDSADAVVITDGEQAAEYVNNATQEAKDYYDESNDEIMQQLEETNQKLDDLANTTAGLVSDNINDNVHIFAMPQPLTTFLDSYEKMCDDLATLEDVTLISQCNEYDYYAQKITENYMSAIAGDITLADFEESTSTTIDPVYNQYEQYFADLEGRATISTAELAEDQMYSTIEAANNLGVSSTTF